MTIGSTSPARVSFDCDGVSKLFPVPIQAYQPTDLTVVLTAPMSAGGGQTTLALNSDYSLATAGTLQPTAWQLTTLPAGAYAAGYKLQVFVNPVQQQQTQYVQGQAFPSLAVQTNLDRLTQMVQRLQDEVTRTPRAPDGDVAPGMQLPASLLRALTYLAFDANGNVVCVPNLPGTAVTSQSVGLLINPRTPFEIAAGVFPVNQIYAAGNVFRYGAKGDGVTDDAPAINTAALCNTVVFFPTPAASYGIKAPIYARPGALQNLTFLGESRTDCVIQPLVTNLADALGINAMFINQAANGKLSFSNIRLSSQVVAYTGITLYAVQGVNWSGAVTYGAGDVVFSAGNTYACILANTNQLPPNATYWTLQPAGVGLCQSIFSGSMDNCWMDTGSTNAGFFKGGLDNYRVSDTTFEFQKGCFLLQGAGGGGDVIFTDNVLSNCYDYFIQSTDAVQKNIISVKGLHAYTHNRGLLFNVINGSSLAFSDVILQASLGVANLGGIGIGSFTNCIDLQLSDLNVMTNAVIGTGPTGTQLTFNNCTGQVSDALFDGVDMGILLTGGALRLSFDHVDIVNTITASLRVLGTAPTGVVTADHCNWSDGNVDLILFSNAGAFDLLMGHCRLMNAGLTAGAGARNVIVNSSGLVRLSDCLIGQNNVLALAGSYFDCSGAGTVLVVDPTIVGNPPTTFSVGAQALTLDGVDSTMPGMPAFLPSVGGSATYTAQQGRWSLKNKTVTFWGRITINALGTGSINTVGGFPFTCSPTYYGGGFVHFFASIATAVTEVTMSITPGTQVATMRSLAAVGTATANNGIFANGADVIFSGSYPL